MPTRPPAAPRPRPRAPPVVNRAAVARLAGVAPTTVSLVLNDNPGTRIAQSTRDRVLAAARQLGYHPSAVASALATGCTRNLGVVLHAETQPFTGYVSEVLDGVWAPALRHGLRLLLTAGQPEQTIAGFYRERAVDGLLALAIPRTADDDEFADAVASAFPLVLVGARPDQLRADYVDIDNFAAGEAATTALLAAGHRHILHLAGPLALLSSAHDRWRGYCQALQGAGITPDPRLVLVADFNFNKVAAVLAPALAQGLHFTAIFAANYGMAWAARQVLAQHGRQVPGDVAIATIDRHADSLRGTEGALYHLEQPCAAIGARALELLESRLSGAYQGPPRDVFMPWRVVPGHSLAPPRAPAP